MFTMANFISSERTKRSVFQGKKKKYYEKYASFALYINSFLIDRHKVLFYKRITSRYTDGCSFVACSCRKIISIENIVTRREVCKRHAV